jgi:hypothetical protein
MSSIVSNNSFPSVSISQNAQASQIRYFKLAVDTFILKMENNLADKEVDYMFEDENQIIEKADDITMMYQNLLISDEKKAELRQYILKEADVFNSKFEEDYGKSYMDNYFDFILSADFDAFEAEKNENADQYKIKKCKEVVVDDSESESEDESVSMFSETQSESDSTDSESESGDEQIEDDIYHVRGQIEEMKYRSRFDFPISGYGIEQKLRTRWQTIHINEAHKEAKDLSIKKEQAKLDRLIEENKQYKMKKSKEVIVDDSKNEAPCEHCEKTDCICDNDFFISKVKYLKIELENMEEERDHFEKENEENVHFINNLKKQMMQKEQEYEKKIYELKHGKPCKCCGQKMKECKCCVVEDGTEYTCDVCNHIEDDCRCCTDFYVGEIRALRKINEKEQLIRTEMAEKLEETNNNERNWMVYAINKDEELKELKKSLEKLKNDTCDYDYILKENNKLKNDYQLREDDKIIIKNLKKELNESKKLHSEVAQELKESEHNHCVDANALFKEIGKNNKLKKQIRLLKLLIK